MKKYVILLLLASLNSRAVDCQDVNQVKLGDEQAALNAESSLNTVACGLSRLNDGGYKFENRSGALLAARVATGELQPSQIAACRKVFPGIISNDGDVKDSQEGERTACFLTTSGSRTTVDQIDLCRATSDDKNELLQCFALVGESRANAAHFELAEKLIGRSSYQLYVNSVAQLARNQNAKEEFVGHCVEALKKDRAAIPNCIAAIGHLANRHVFGYCRAQNRKTAAFLACVAKETGGE